MTKIDGGPGARYIILRSQGSRYTVENIPHWLQSHPKYCELALRGNFIANIPHYILLVIEIQALTAQITCVIVPVLSWLAVLLVPHSTPGGRGPIRTRYLGHMTGYEPIRGQYFPIRTYNLAVRRQYEVVISSTFSPRVCSTFEIYRWLNPGGRKGEVDPYPKVVEFWA